MKALLAQWSRRLRSTPNPPPAQRATRVAAEQPGHLWALATQLPPLLPVNHEVRGQLAGEQRARQLGAGLDFEQLRPYQPGDAPKTIDWRASARLGEPYVRLYRQTQQASCTVVVDRRPGMWFGTRRRLKIVQALNLAHLHVSAANRQGMPVRLIPFPDQGEPLPQSTDRRQLAVRVDALGERVQDDGVTLASVLEELVHQSQVPGSLVVLISDFHDLDDRARTAIRQLGQTQMLRGLLIRDPAEIELPDIGIVTLQDANGARTRIDTHGRALRRELAERAAAHEAHCRKTFNELGAPLLTVLTSDEMDTLLPALVGAS